MNKKKKFNKKFLLVLVAAVLVTALFVTPFAAAGEDDSAPAGETSFSMEKESETNAQVGAPIELSTSVNGSGSDKNAIVRIVLPGGVSLNNHMDIAADSRIASAAVRPAAEVLAEVEAEMVASSEASSLSSSSDADSSSSLAESDVESSSAQSIASTSDSENSSSAASSSSSSNISSMQENSSVASQPEKDAEEDSISETEETPFAVEENSSKVALPASSSEFLSALTNAANAGGSVLEFRLVDGFTGELTLNFSVVANAESWSEGDTLTLVSAYNAQKAQPSFFRSLFGAQKVDPVQEVRTLGIGLYAIVSVATIGGENNEPLKVSFWDNGRQDVRVGVNGNYGKPMGTRDDAYQQWYAPYNNSFAVRVEDALGTTTYMNDYFAIWNSAAPRLPIGVVEQIDSRTASVTFTILRGTGNIVLKATYYLAPGARFFNATYDVTNNTGGAIDKIRVIFGGDTYFAGSDSGYPYYNALLNMVYVYRNASNGIMSISGDASTPFDRYYAGSFSSGANESSKGDLSNYQLRNSTDAGLYTGWTREGVADGQGFSVKSIFQWTEAAPVQIVAPSGKFAPPGVELTYEFLIMNFSATPVTLDLATASENGWTTSIAGNSTITVPGGGDAVVTVNLSTSGSATNGMTDDVTLTATRTGPAATYTAETVTTIDTTMPAIKEIRKVSQTDTELVVAVDFINTPGPHSTKVTILNMDGTTTTLTQTKTIMSGDTYTFDISGLTLNSKYVVEADARPAIAYPARTTFTLASTPVISAPAVSIFAGETFNPLAGVTITDAGVAVTPVAAHVAGNNIVAGVAGNYTVTYAYTNAQGNTGRATRAVTLKPYTVEYNTDGGNAIASKANVNWADANLLPAANPTKANHVFMGWEVSVGGVVGTAVSATSKYQDLSTNAAVGAITVKAKWHLIQNPTLTVAKSAIAVNTNSGKASDIPYASLTEQAFIQSTGAVATADPLAVGLTATAKSDFAAKLAAAGGMFTPNNTYTVKVWAEDADGRKSAETSVTLTITDNTAPTAIIQNTNINFRKDSAGITDAAVLASAQLALSDDFASAAHLAGTPSIVWTTPLDISTIGQYTGTIEVRDTVGNVGVASLTVTVWKERITANDFTIGTREVPEMSLQKYIEYGTAKAYYDDGSGEVEVTITAAGSSDMIRKPGVYTATYTTARGTVGTSSINVYQSKYYATIVFGNGQSNVVHYIYPGEYIPHPAPYVNPSRDGHTFLGWVGNGVNWIFGEYPMEEGDITIYAYWRLGTNPPASSSSSRIMGTSSGAVVVGSSSATSSSQAVSGSSVTSGTSTSGGDTGGSSAVAGGTGSTTGAASGASQQPASSGNVQISNGGAPLNGTPDSWGLINLVLMALGVLGSIVLLINMIMSKSEDGVDRSSGMLWRVLALVTSVVGVVVFFLTANLSQPMVLVNKWTIVCALIILVETAFVVMMTNARKRKPENEYA